MPILFGWVVGLVAIGLVVVGLLVVAVQVARPSAGCAVGLVWVSWPIAGGVVVGAGLS